MPPTPWFDWQQLRNPIYAHPGWSVKDACLATNGSEFFIFASAFFAARGQERSHIFAVCSRDLQTWSEPRFLLSGEAQGWIGLCSPNITTLDEGYVLTYNSWGDHPQRPNQLHYARSADLENWCFGPGDGYPLAPELTTGTRAIDAAITHQGDRFFLVWKEGQTPQIAWASTLDGPWHRVGTPSGGWFENAQFLTLDGLIHLLVTGEDHAPHLMQLQGDPVNPESWLHWSRPRRLNVPRERFNLHDRANAAFLTDWRAYDGYHYLLYAGTTEGHSHARRGDNRLGLARSRDLQSWAVPSSE